MRLVHTSDLHLYAAHRFEDDLAMVRGLAATVRALRADLLAIAGDLFDHNRVPHAGASQLMAALVEPGIPVVVLPGNHDPLTPGSIYRHLAPLPGLFVLGLDGAHLRAGDGWTITGRAHMDYRDFPPLALGDDPDAAAGERERIVLAHGHFDLAGDARAVHRPGWLFTDDDLDQTAAGYVGLGHWDRAYAVRAAGPPAYYSGSPLHAESVNVVDLEPGQPARVDRAALHEAKRAR